MFTIRLIDPNPVTYVRIYFENYESYYHTENRIQAEDFYEKTDAGQI